jgi:hypothetical protein
MKTHLFSAGLLAGFLTAALGATASVGFAQEPGAATADTLYAMMYGGRYTDRVRERRHPRYESAELAAMEEGAQAGRGHRSSAYAGRRTDHRHAFGRGGYESAELAAFESREAAEQPMERGTSAYSGRRTDQLQRIR